MANSMVLFALFLEDCIVFCTGKRKLYWSGKKVIQIWKDIRFDFIFG